MSSEANAAELKSLFDRDHVKLLTLLADVRFLCRNGSYPPAAKVFAEFRLLQEHHLAKEEALLARLEAAGDCPAPLVAKATADHRALRDRIAATWSAMTCNDDLEFSRQISRLAEAVTAHERDERDTLLPALQAALGDPRAIGREVHELIER